MYHLVATLVKDIWKINILALSSINELDEHHKWYVMMCVEGSSLGFPSNFGISNGNLEGIIEHNGSWAIGSFVNHEKSSKYSVARKYNGANEYWEGCEVSVVPNGPCGPPIFLLLEGWETLKSEYLLGWWNL
jgi:hypothetical protein